MCRTHGIPAVRWFNPAVGRYVRTCPACEAESYAKVTARFK